MNAQSRRGVLKNVVAMAGAAALSVPAEAQTTTTARKKAMNRTPPGGKPSPNYSDIVTSGNFIFLSGVGAPKPGTIQEQTKYVLDELEQNLKAAGSSMENVLKVNVYLSNIANFDGMNSVYVGRFGKYPPVRTTIAAAALVGGSLVEIDLIATK